MLDPLLLVQRSPRQGQLLALAGDLGRRFAGRAAQHDREGSFPVENFAELVAARYHVLSVPQRYGGWGATLLESVLAQEQLARGDGATALVAAMPIHLIGGAAEAEVWPEAQLQRVCKAMVDEGALINAAASEPQLGSPSRGGLPATTARRADDGWRISGRKSFVTGIPVLTHLIVTATIEGSTQVGSFLVRTDLPGLSVEPTWDALGMRSTASDDVILDGVLVRDADLLALRDPAAPDRSKSGSAWFSLIIAAVYLGVGAAARDAAVTYAQERRPTNLNGLSIASTEPVQRRLGEIESCLLAARSLLYSVAEGWDRRPEQRPALYPYTGLCKATATNAAVAAADAALLVAGGAGMQRSLPFERFIRDVRAGLFHPPSTEAALAAVGRALTSADPKAAEEER